MISCPQLLFSWPLHLSSSPSSWSVHSKRSTESLHIHHHLLNSHMNWSNHQTYLRRFLDDNLVNYQVHVTYHHQHQHQGAKEWIHHCQFSLLSGTPSPPLLLDVLDHSLRLLLHWRWWFSCWHILDRVIAAFASPSLFEDFLFCVHVWIFFLLSSFGIIAFSIKRWSWCWWKYACSWICRLLAMDWVRLISDCFWFWRQLLVEVWVFDQSPSWQQLAYLGASSCAGTCSAY